MKKLAIMQPYLFPYIGYFQSINSIVKPNDNVIAANENHKVIEFVALSFMKLGIAIEWKG